MAIRDLSQMERDAIAACPWCGSKCQGIESRDDGRQILYRAGVRCDAARQADLRHGDAGPDWGRTGWTDTIQDAVDLWNMVAEWGKDSDQIGVW